ncbi:MAG: rRNA maturation RNase YbeY [Verrucomicrobia bacterium]|nr:rRNA maturation RNase YbeY [Verrucomicrobiota bacterium]MBS0646456.1 rRNA maturation RNase YbeY [Verrucomicrobiota bacterium]
MEIAVLNQQEDLPIDPLSVESVVAFVLEQMKTQPDEVSIYFVSEDEICSLHKDFFNDPAPTDCISLPIDPVRTAAYQHLGEIFVCPKTAFRYLELTSADKTVYQEVTLYVVHGLLHLLGYDDLSKEERKKMISQQNLLLQKLLLNNLLITN